MWLTLFLQHLFWICLGDIKKGISEDSWFLWESGIETEYTQALNIAFQLKLPILYLVGLSLLLRYEAAFPGQQSQQSPRKPEHLHLSISIWQFCMHSNLNEDSAKSVYSKIVISLHLAFLCNMIIIYNQCTQASFFWSSLWPFYPLALNGISHNFFFHIPSNTWKINTFRLCIKTHLRTPEFTYKQKDWATGIQI